MFFLYHFYIIKLSPPQEVLFDLLTSNMVSLMTMFQSFFLYHWSLILSFFHFFLVDYSWSKYKQLVYLYWPWHPAEPQQDERFLVSLLIYSNVIDIIYFISSSMISCNFRPHDIFAMLAGFFLVYFPSFLFLPWMMFLPSGLRDNLLDGVSIFINYNNL